MEQRFTFNKVAELYDRARAGYPQALYDDLMEFADLSAGDLVLKSAAAPARRPRRWRAAA